MQQYQTSMVVTQADSDLLQSTVLLPGIRVWNLYTKRFHLGDGVTVGGQMFAPEQFSPEMLADYLGLDVVSGDTMVPDRYAGYALPKMAYDLAAGTRKSIDIWVGCDSFAGISFATFATQLLRYLPPLLNGFPFYCAAFSEVYDYLAATYPPFGKPPGITYGASATTAGSYTGTATQLNKTVLGYTMLPNGSPLQLAAGQYAIFAYGGQSVTGDTIFCNLIKSVGSGSIRIRIAPSATPPAYASGLWRDPTVDEITSGHALDGAGHLVVDTNGAITGTVPVIVPAGGIQAWSVMYEQVGGGTCYAEFPMVAVRKSPAINIMRHTAASNDAINMNASADAVMAAFWAAYNPALCVHDNDDPAASYPTLFARSLAWRTLAAQAVVPHMVYVVPPYNKPGNGGDVRYTARREILYPWAAQQYGVSIADAFAEFGGYNFAVAAGDDQDGIHYQGIAASVAAAAWTRRMFPSIQPSRAPGGSATAGQIITAAGAGQVTANGIRAIACAPNVSETGYMTWAYAGTSGGNMAAASGNSVMSLATGATAAAAVRAYVNSINSGMGKNQGSAGLVNVLAFGFRVRMQTTSANAQFYALMRGNTAYNAAAAGVLTDKGVGFRIVNGTIDGLCWGNAAGAGASSLIISSTTGGVARNGTGSVALVTGGVADFVDCLVELFPGEINQARGRVRWWVDGTLIGEGYYDDGTFNFGYELLSTGGATTNFTAEVTFPKIMTSGLTAP